MASSSSSGTHIIQDNDHILLKKADKLRLFQVQKGRTIWLDKAKFKLDGVIGQPYGTLFEVKGDSLVKMQRQKTDTSEEKTDKGLDTEKDNRNLHDLDSNQRLTADEIVQMKKEGVTGDELIGQLIENSATFQNKTEYAQEKWVKKKKKKHVLEFTVLKPNSRLLCDMYVSKGPSRICNLRTDSLAQILTYGNVRAHSTVAVFDTCLGLVTGAVLERLGGFGKVINFYYGDTPMKTQLDAYGFPQEVMDTLYQFPLELVSSLKTTNQSGPPKENSSTVEGTTPDESHVQTSNGGIEMDTDQIATETDADQLTSETEGAGHETKQESDEGGEDLQTMDSEQSGEQDSDTITSVNKEESRTSNTKTDLSAKDSEKVDTGDNAGAEQTADSVKNGDVDNHGGKQKRRNKNKRPTFEEREAAREVRAREVEAARQIILEKNIDCLIIACKFHPTPVVTSLVDFLAPSRQVVVYSQFKEALQDCYVHMREHGGLVSFRLSETWLRNYQILPNRTHPVIQMSGTGGYLLTATTVIKPE